MNILIPTWVWYQVGGDWTYINNVRNLYEQHGHKVIPFAMKSERNVGTEEFEKYFVDLKCHQNF